MFSLVLKKFITSKTKGTVTKELEKGKYLVEYDSEEGVYEAPIAKNSR